jgi:hypothetical protein
MQTGIAYQKGFHEGKQAAAAQPVQEPYDQTALELCNVCGWKTLIPDDGCLNCERAQPAQEPVAWAIYDKRGGSKSLHWPENHSPNGDATKFDAVPLYTTPPQRPWVGLTDEEIEGCLHHVDDEAVIGLSDFARAVEQLLRGKNT